MSAAERLKAEVGGEVKPLPKRPTTRASSDFDLFGAANAAEPLHVLERLGIAHHETPRGVMAVCPGCGEDGALLCKDGGLKCLHDRCAAAGPRGNPGYRTNVDLVAHVEQLEPAAAAKLICKWNGIAVPERRRESAVAPPEDDYVHTDDDVPASEATTPQADPAPLRKLSELIEPALERAQLRSSGKEKPVPVPFREYAGILQGGYFPGVHAVVGGTGVGKSQFVFQNATHAAREGVPTLYVALELSEFQVALRTLGETAGISWSRMYTGRIREGEVDKARAAAAELAQLPFYVEFGSPHGWGASNLWTRTEQIRKQHPHGPALVVLDFLQLVGADADGNGRSPELRERIARAAYMGVQIANRFDAAVLLVSATARDKYGAGGLIREAGITSQITPGHVEATRAITNPDALLGIGKEAGEIEYSAESQTVLLKWPSRLDNGEKAVIVAVPKLRYGSPGWVAMSFWQRFNELPFRDVDELPQSGAGGNGRRATPSSELKDRLKVTIRRAPELTTKTAIVRATTGTKGDLLAAFDDMVTQGELLATEKGFAVREGANQ